MILIDDTSSVYIQRMNVMYKGEYTEKIRKSMDNDLGDLLDLCNLVSLFYHSILLICTHMMSPRHSKISSSSWLPIHVRKLSDAEVAARAVVRHILKTPPFITSNSKLAFLFLTPGTLPFERLWDRFFQVHFFFLTNCYLRMVCC